MIKDDVSKNALTTSLRSQNVEMIVKKIEIKQRNKNSQGSSRDFGSTIKRRNRNKYLIS